MSGTEADWMLRAGMALLALSASACSLLLDSGSPGTVQRDGGGQDADAAVDDAGPSGTDFETDLGPWTVVPGSNCSRMMPESSSNMALCCTGDAGLINQDAIYLQLDEPDPAVEVRFRLYNVNLPADGAEDESFSPAAAFHGVSSADGIIDVNYNVYPNGAMGAFSSDEGQLSVDTALTMSPATWYTVRLGIAPDMNAWLAIDGDDPVQIPLTMSPDINYVLLGVFRQGDDTGMVTRCFDDIRVRPVSGGP